MGKTTVIIGENGGGCDIHLRTGQNLYTGINKFTDEFVIRNQCVG